MRSLEIRQKIAEATRLAMQRVDVRERHRIGCKNRIVSEDGRRKQSVAQKKRYEWDISPSKRPGVAEKISVAMKGKCISIDTREKMSIAGKMYVKKLSVQDRKRKYGAHNVGRVAHNRGIPQTLEVRKKLSESVARAYIEGRMPVLDTHALYDGKNGKIWMRSTWEVKVAEWMDENDIEWKYQSEFIETPFGMYVPDFELGKNNFVEVKGREWKSYQLKKIDWCVNHGCDVRVVNKTNIRNINLNIGWLQRQSGRQMVVPNIEFLSVD
jgi:hypothetical protein